MALVVPVLVGYWSSGVQSQSGRKEGKERVSQREACCGRIAASFLPPPLFPPPPPPPPPPHCSPHQAGQLICAKQLPSSSLQPPLPSSHLYLLYALLSRKLFDVSSRYSMCVLLVGFARDSAYACMGGGGGGKSFRPPPPPFQGFGN